MWRARRDGAIVEGDCGLSTEICWQAIYSRDPRFDGRFFAGATTTGLYCRNVCPVPFARPRNVVLFACAAAAEAAGFRACKRCQAQAAPGTPAWLGTSAVVSRAFRLILEGALNDGNVEELANRLGLGSRQLRRLFVQHLGAPPLKIATTHRIHLARKLIEESGFSMSRIAASAGFRSIREFNHSIRMSTGQSPRELRRSAGAQGFSGDAGGLVLRLPYRMPFDWAGLIAFLKRRAIPGVEAVTDRRYQRTIQVGQLGQEPGYLTVEPDEAGSRLVVRLETNSYDGLGQTVERIRRIFDLGADPVQIASHLSRDDKLRDLLAARPGLRVPGVWDGFEAAVMAVLGERLTGVAARNTVRRLVERFGTPVETPIRGLKFLFPTPDALAKADLAEFSCIGISEARTSTLKKLAGTAVLQELRSSASKTLEEAVSQLRLVDGIDESTAHCIAMRAFGEPDAFPAREIGLRRRLAGAGSLPTAEEAAAMAAPWRPWRAYAAMYVAG